MEEDIGIEPNSIQLPYLFRSRLACPFSFESIEEGEHHIPRTFQSFPRVVRPFAPNISLVPIQVVPLDTSEDNILLSEESNLSERSDLTELIESEIMGFLDHTNLYEKVQEIYNKHPDVVAKLLESYLGGTDFLKLVAFESLELHYLKSDGPRFNKLKDLYVEALKFYVHTENMRQYMKTKEEGVSYYKERLLSLMMKTEGLSNNVFLNYSIARFVYKYCLLYTSPSPRDS